MVIRRQQVEDLSRVDGSGCLVTSCYLNTDGGRSAGQQYQIALKDMLRTARERLDEIERPAKVRQSALEDLELIRSWFEDEFDRRGARSVALFSCAATGLWEIFPLPRRMPSLLVQDQTAYVRPLTHILDEHPRFCTVVVDREHARIFEVCLGEIEETSEIRGEVPDQVRFGGWRGYEEKRVTRSIEDKVHRHYRNIAEQVMAEFHRRRFDWLLVGGYREAHNEFTGFLHSYLQQRLRATFEIDPAAAPPALLKKVREVVRRLEREEEEDLVARLVTLSRKEGAAVLGVEGTLEALHRGAVHTLVVGDEYKARGYRCSDCGRLSLLQASCPSCEGKGLEPVPHLIDEAIEEALVQGGEVEHLSHIEALDQDIHLGAMLRFRIPGANA